MQKLDAKVDRHFHETVKEIGGVVERVGDKLDESRVTTAAKRV